MITLLTLATAIAGSTTGPATAGATDDFADVRTDPAGAHVALGRDGTWREAPHHSGGGGGSGTPEACPRRWQLASGNVELRKTPTGEYRTIPIETPQPGPEYRVYHVWCTDGAGEHYLGSAWLRAQQFGVDPRVLAQRAVRDLPYPAASVGANPAGRGLTGLESWFWVAGYSGAPITDTVTEFGFSVTVEATPMAVSWDFGDGTTAKGAGLGTPPPGRSTVTHTFEVRRPTPIRVRALLRLAVRWRLGAGPWQDLDPVLRTAILDYPVIESRAALVPDR